MKRHGTATLALLGMLPAAAQTVQPAARAPVVFASKLPAPAFNLPQPVTNLFRDPAGATGVVAGTGSVKGWRILDDGKTAEFNQGSAERVLLNWNSFDIANGYTVRFIQDQDPARYVSALNRVWGTAPSVIQGQLIADREVLLVNPNGVYFGATARVQAGKFVASALSVSDAAYQRGIRNVVDGTAVFTSAGTDHLPTNPNAAVTLEAGAEITTAAGGDVLLVAPRVVNRGRIETPAGQTVLAAGDKVYLMSSSDPAQRGLVVAVDPIKLAQSIDNDPTLGIVENAASGSTKTIGGATVADSTPDNTSGLVMRLNEIRAAGGSVNLVGLTVRQNGQINATTAVKGANGVVLLQAMASTVAVDGGLDRTASSFQRGVKVEAGSTVRLPAALGTVEIGAGSSTSVLPDAGAATQLDAEVFNASRIRVEGQTIVVGRGAALAAPSGTIELLASSSAVNNLIFAPQDGGILPADASRLVIEPGATLSVAGVRGVAVDGSRNQASQRLFQIELADAPVQRGGPLYRAQVFFNGADTAGIQAANVSGAAATVTRTASEKSTAGGSLTLQSDGAIVVGSGAVLDVSGGSIAVSQASIAESLVEQNGRVVTFAKASAGNRVTALLPGTLSTTVPAYEQGASGGALVLNARQIALDGDALAGVTIGSRQRDGSTPLPQPASLTLGLGDRVRGYYLGSIDLLPAAPTPLSAAFYADPLNVPLPEAAAASPLPLPKVQAAGFGRLNLRADAVLQSAPGALDLGPGGSLTVEAHRIALDGRFAASGGTVSLLTPNAAGDADRSGDGDIDLAAGTTLDMAGRWTNDALPGSGAVPALNGGRINVDSAHSLRVAPGAVLDVSAGAWLNGGGSLTRGKAGSVTLATSNTNPELHPTLALTGVSIAAYDFSAGGSMSIRAPSLTVGDPGAGGFVLDDGFFGRGGFGSVAVSGFSGVRVASGAQIAPRLLNWALLPTSRQVASGAMSAAAAPLVTDTALADRSPVNISLAAMRGALVTSASNADAGADAVVERGAVIDLDPGAALKISAQGSVLVGATGGAGATAGQSGQTGQTTRLSAPGGSIALGIDAQRNSIGDPLGFVATQAIWLGADASLSVAGTALLRPAAASFATSGQFNAAAIADAGARATGTVFGGGTIALNAGKGYVIAEAGSRLNLDGAAATLNLPGSAAPVVVAKAGGTLDIATPEGFALEGSISAQAPRDRSGQALADGGRLQLSVGAGGVQSSDPTALNPYPATPRTLLVGASAARLAGAAPGVDLSTRLGNGVGYAGMALLRDAGFSMLSLGAGDVIRFDGSLALTAPLGIVLDAPAIAATAGSRVTLAAAFAQLGPSAQALVQTPDTGAVPDASPDRSTTLTLTAPTIDVVGSVGLQGFSSVALDAGPTAAGEIRLRAANANFNEADSRARTLAWSGLLTLTAAQIYATSATQYTLAGLPAAGAADAGSRLVVRGAAGGAPALQPLSALASLTVFATDIDQGGVLRQPFGAIALNAERTLNLLDGSVTSVSGSGGAVLFGSTQNLSAWYAPILTTQLPVAKGIRLAAATITTAAAAPAAGARAARLGAVVDAAGGGQLQAWELFPGVGGSGDIYARSGVYAVLPDYASALGLTPDSSPLPNAASRSTQFVVTMPGSGLAPGRYAVLPARDALLGAGLPQGAYLIAPAPDQGRAVLNAPIAQDDGSTVITGYLSAAGSITYGAAAMGQRFVVTPLATARAASDVRLSDVSDLLRNSAAALGRAQPELPVDGGRLQVLASAAAGSNWDAATRLGAGGGRAGTWDVSASNIALVGARAAASADALSITAATLNDSAAGSVLLGGLRSADVASDTQAAPGWTIDSSATASLRVDLAGQPLKVEELLLAAAGQVDIARTGTAIDASLPASLGPRTITQAGDGALVAVSADRLTLARGASAGLSGAVSINSATAAPPAAAAAFAPSSLAGASIGIDAATAVVINPQVVLRPGALTLAAQRLVLGSAQTLPTGATAIDGALLATVRASDTLTLRGTTSIDFAGVQDWARRGAATPAVADPAPTAVPTRLTLDAPLLQGVVGAGGVAPQVDIAAQDIAVLNSRPAGTAPTPSTLPTSAAGEGGGTLVLHALPPLRYGNSGGLTLGPGDVQLGFASARLRSGADIVADGRGSLSGQGDVALSAARVTASAGADFTLRAAGALTLGAEAAGHTLSERVGSGALLQLQADTIAQNARLELPGGALVLNAAGAALGSAGAAAITFGAGSITSLAGFSLQDSHGNTADGLAGSVRASAANGAIAVDGLIDVSAARRADGSAGSGDGGAITLSAPQGTVSIGGRLAGAAGSGAGDIGGRLVVDAGAMPSADAIAGAAVAGAMGGEFTLRVRSGDVALDTSLAAQRIAIAADGGRLMIGTNAPTLLDARAPGGGVVQLAAGSDVVLSGGAAIDARSSRSGAAGGDVLIASAAGSVVLDAQARIDARAADAGSGRIVLRAPRDAGNSSVQIAPLAAAQLQASEVDIEAVRRYADVSTIAGGSTRGATLGMASVAADNNAFMQNAPQLLASLGVAAADAGRVRLQPGVEVLSSGDLTLASDWNLATARPGGQTGWLSLRAAGGLRIDANLSDGFADVAASSALLPTAAQSWSLRLVAGADLAAANPLAVLGPGSGGTLTLGNGRIVRTGAGSIDLAAAQNIVFEGAPGSATPGRVYVAGQLLSGDQAPPASLFSRQAAKPVFTVGGGRLTVSAGADIVAPEPGQLINNWLWRSGQFGAVAGQYSPASQPAWWSQFSSFGQTLGAFGGGDVAVAAGGNIVNLQVMAPSQGWMDSSDSATAQLHVLPGGQLTVRAGGDVLGGQFLLGNSSGQGRLVAGGVVGTVPGNQGLAAPLLGLLDGAWRVSARNGLALAGVFDPTVAPPSAGNNRPPVSGYFFTWGPDAGLWATTNAGDVRVSNGPNDSATVAYGLSNTGSRNVYFTLLPPSLSATAAVGSVGLLSAATNTVASAVLFPSRNGQFALWAGRDVVLAGPDAVAVAMADSDPSLWPSPRFPVASNSSQLTALLTNTLDGTRTGSSLHADDAAAAVLHAGGSLLMSGSPGSATLRLPKRADIVVGGDLVAPGLVTQNLHADDVTRIDIAGSWLPGATGGVTVAGPGLVDVAVGHNADLGASAGITTTGNLGNPLLPAQGASVRLAAGLAGTLDLAVLNAQYLQPATAAGGSARWQQSRDALQAFVRNALQAPTLNWDDAWAQFQTFPADARAAFGRQLLASEFAAVYLSGPAPTAAGVQAALRERFERDRIAMLAAIDDALARGAAAAAGAAPIALSFPGRELYVTNVQPADTNALTSVRTAASTFGDRSALAAYRDTLQQLSFATLDTAPAVAARLAALQAVRDGWRDTVARSLGARNANSIDLLAASNPADPLVAAFNTALVRTSGSTFEAYRQQVAGSELASSGRAASNFGRLALPMRLALFDDGFTAAELASIGSFVPQPVWPGTAPLLQFAGTVNLTQSSVITQRGGDITLQNPGGAINVGLKPFDNRSGLPSGVIALGGGNVLGYARDDFQVNTQRVFIVGQGDMNIWSSRGDIDSGRGANTAVAAPPLAPRRSADGVVFEVPATTTGSGLGILEDAAGQRSGTIGLFPAFGEILALDAFIRAPALVLSAPVKGSDNLVSASVSGTGAPVRPPALALAAPSPAATQARAADNDSTRPGTEQRRNSLLTVELLGLGPAENARCRDPHSNSSIECHTKPALGNKSDLNNSN